MNHLIMSFPLCIYFIYFIYFTALPHHKTQKLEVHRLTLNSTTAELRYAVLSSTAVNM